MKEKDIVIVVIASKKDIYDKTVKYYWNPMIEYVNKNYLNIKIYMLYGNSYDKSLNINHENLLKFNVEENYKPGILKKTILAFDYINKNYKYQSIIRTNISSFLVLDNILKKYNELKKIDLLYAGVKGIAGNIPFASGALFWVNKKTIEIILENKDKIDYNVIDDVSISRLLHNKVNITPLKRFNKLMNLKNLEELKKNILLIKSENHYHIRLKSKNRNNDIPVFNILTKLYYSLK